MAAKRRTTSDGKQRRCSRCKKLKQRAEFPRNKATADGLALYCRPCKRSADRGQPARELAPQHPPPAKMGVEQNSDDAAPRSRAPALAITDELIDRACSPIREFGATRRAAARFVGVSENTFKSWLREGADQKDPCEPRARLLFAVETAEGEAERTLTQAYWEGARMDPQVAQRFLERRFSKGDEKWARTEHLTVSDGDAAPMEANDARKLLADRLGKLLSARDKPGASGSTAREGADAAGEPATGGTPGEADAGGSTTPSDGAA